MGRLACRYDSWALTRAVEPEYALLGVLGRRVCADNGLSPLEVGQADRDLERTGLFRVAALSRDCRYFVTGYDGVNVVRLDYDPRTVMLTFYRNGEVFATIELATLIRDLSKLRRTASHLYWGEYIGVERGRFYRVETVDRGQMLFDMTTGRAL